MSIQCPHCSSYTDDAAAAFCAQCGMSLRKRRSSPGSRGLGPWLLLGVLICGIAATAYIVWEPESDQAGGRRGQPVGPNGSARRARPRTVRPSDRAETPNSDESKPLREEEIRNIAETSTVVLELGREDGRKLNDVPAVLVHGSGVVLTTLAPLLGAQSGVARISGRRQLRKEILGAVYYDREADLALLRIENDDDRDLPHAPLLDVAFDRVFRRGDRLRFFTGLHLREGAVSDVYFDADGGVEGMRFAPTPRVPPDSIFALDEYGYVAGLSLPLLRGEKPVGRRTLKATADYRMLVVAVNQLVPYLDREETTTLNDLTREFYDGSFDDLVLRGSRSVQTKDWAAAIDLLSQAVQAAEFESVDPKRLETVVESLKASYAREAQSLQARQLITDARELVAFAIDNFFPEDEMLWKMLAEYRAADGLLREAIDAFLQLRKLAPGKSVNSRLEESYIALSNEGRTKGDDRLAETALLEAIEQLPNSGRLHFELARLYQEWEAFDDAIEIYQTAANLDRSLAAQARIFIDKIEDVLSRRDAVVIPISDARVIKTSITIDGRHEVPVIVDTGATHTTLPKRFAERMGYNYEAAERVRLRTAGGTTYGRRIRLQSVDLEGHSVRNIDAIILPDSVNLESGLLGMNFLEHFRYSVDTERREFRLERQNR